MCFINPSDSAIRKVKGSSSFKGFAADYQLSHDGLVISVKHHVLLPIEDERIRRTYHLHFLQCLRVQKVEKYVENTTM